MFVDARAFRLIVAGLALAVVANVVAITKARADVGNQWDVLADAEAVKGTKLGTGRQKGWDSWHGAGRPTSTPYARGSVIGGRPAACHRFPATKRRYCGCASALYIGLSNHDGRWNLARNWFAFPRAEPGPGKAIVRRHHVKIIIGGRPGAWEIYDPNSGGGLTRIYTTARLGGVVVDPSARRYAEAR